MAPVVINGNKIAKIIKEEVRTEVDELRKIGIVPKLAVILVGDNHASKIYFKNRLKATDETNIENKSYNLPKESKLEQLLELIDKLNKDKDIHGILVQMPLPKHINPDHILLAIKPEKDVDCFNPYNIGLLHTDLAVLKPCTPNGIIEMLKHSNIDIAGKYCVVIGRSNVVGRPTAALLESENATVTTVHSYTKNISSYTKNADILVSAVGKAGFVTEDMIKEGAIVIDVGMNHKDGKLCGDVDYDNVAKKTSYITPVPGGVGPMTTSMLVMNCLIACKLQQVDLHPVSLQAFTPTSSGGVL